MSSRKEKLIKGSPKGIVKKEKSQSPSSKVSKTPRPLFSWKGLEKYRETIHELAHLLVTKHEELNKVCSSKGYSDVDAMGMAIDTIRDSKIHYKGFRFGSCCIFFWKRSLSV